MLEDEYTLYIYTDGSAFYGERGKKAAGKRKQASKPPKKQGGVGILFLYSADNGRERIYEMDEPGYQQATSQEMELRACAIALKEAEANPLFARYRSVVIYTDCQTLVDCYLIAERYWQHNGWLLADGFPVANAPLWKEFLKAKRKLKKPVELQKVKAHARNIHNNRVDRLAKQSAAQPYNRPLQVRRMRRKISKNFTVRGSVGIKGQIISIHIIETRYLHEQRLEWYRYEVVNPDSEYFEQADIMASELTMKAGHFYEVRLNREPKNPRVVEVIQEIDWPASESAN